MEKERVKEIDILRFFAIVLMVIYHVIYDIDAYTNININCNSLVWQIIGKVSAIIFIFVSGVSSGFSRSTIKRGAYVFLWGMVVTVSTYIFDKTQYVRFGILHFIGISMIISYFLKNAKIIILFMIAFIIALLGPYINSLVYKTAALLPLGIMYKGFTTFDYYPIIPYISLFIMGMIFQRIFYKNKRSRLNIKVPYIMNYISENSLSFYIIHQPIILLILYLLKILRI